MLICLWSFDPDVLFLHVNFSCKICQRIHCLGKATQWKITLCVRRCIYFPFKVDISYDTFNSGKSGYWELGENVSIFCNYLGTPTKIFAGVRCTFSVACPNKPNGNMNLWRCLASRKFYLRGLSSFYFYSYYSTLPYINFSTDAIISSFFFKGLPPVIIDVCTVQRNVFALIGLITMD